MSAVLEVALQKDPLSDYKEADLGSHKKLRPTFPENLKAILSDLDGTLIFCDRGDMCRFSKEIAAHFGYSLESLMTGQILSTLDQMYEYISAECIRHERAVIDRDFFRHECYMKLGKLRDTLTDPLPGIIEALSALQEAGILCALCTARDHDSRLYGLLQEKGLSKHLSAIITREDPYTSGAVKDHVFGRGSSTVWASPEECIVIGDTKDDMSSGRRMGMYTVGVLTGLNTAAELYEAGACVVLESFAELPVFISVMQSKQSSNASFLVEN